MATIKHLVGDLFAAPRNAILVHACNTQGSWGGGIAVEFHARYPAAFKVYRAHCLEHDSESEDIIGTCLLIPGAADDEHDIACLFTSRRYGARKDKPAQILDATESALRDLMRQNVANKELHACKINSGKFGVPWADTEAVIRRVGASVMVYTPPKELEAKTLQTADAKPLPKSATPSQRGSARGRGRGTGRQMTLGAFGVGSRSTHKSARGAEKRDPSAARLANSAEPCSQSSEPS